jgi:hypothetical protein
VLSLIHSLCLNREVFHERLVDVRSNKVVDREGSRRVSPNMSTDESTGLLGIAFDNEIEHDEFELKES